MCETPAIVRVGGFVGDYFSVDLSNGHSVTIPLAGRIHEPAFVALIENKTFDRPKTDGKRLYWTDDGPSLYFNEILETAVG